MIRISPSHVIFSSEAFQRDKHQFYLILQNLSSENAIIYSDESSYVVCRGRSDWPAWIWTIDHFDSSKLSEIEQAIRLLTIDGVDNKFVCKKELYDLLLEDKFEKVDATEYFEMNSLHCTKPKTPSLCDGYLGTPSADDLELLADYFYDCCNETSDDHVSIRNITTQIQDLYNNNSLYVWKNDSDKIVCMIAYKSCGDMARLMHVYTPPAYRRKGYASNLVHDLTRMLLSKGITPVLYTDYNYDPSNLTYKGVGYKEDGMLIQFACFAED